MGTRVGRQRCMLAEGHLLLVLHAPPKTHEPTRTGRFFWRAPDGTWKSTEQGAGISALNKHLDQYNETIAALEQLLSGTLQRQTPVSSNEIDYLSGGMNDIASHKHSIGPMPNLIIFLIRNDIQLAATIRSPAAFR